MDEARKVPDGSVGNSQAFMIIRPDGRMEQIQPDVQFLRDWKNAFRDRTSTISIDSSALAGAQVRNVLQRYATKRTQ
jgi:hypothetical protein